MRRIPYILALFATLTVASPVGAACSVPSVTSVKGSISGTFYATDGTPTKVKCPVTITRGPGSPGTSGYLTFDWGSCPGISTYGTGLYTNPGLGERILKDGAPVKSCVISNQYTFDVIKMSVTISSIITTADLADPTVPLKEKGTMVFTRNDGIFSGKFTATYPAP